MTAQQIASTFGATDIVSERGDEGAASVRDLTDGFGTDHALECVGTAQSWQSALGAVRDGGRIGYVGVPAGVSEWISAGSLYGRNVGVERRAVKVVVRA
jgi:threonine dehydrogenase-like Zn-dependent dehydrogenase